VSEFNIWNGCGRTTFSRSKSDEMTVINASMQPYLVAHWKGGEPIIDGFGSSPWIAQNMARRCEAPIDAELCLRVVGETMVWRGQSGRVVTVEDFLEIDN
jgi:hypothetical protein